MGKTKPNEPLGYLPDKQATELLMKLMATAGKSGEEQAVAELVSKHLRKAGALAKAITFDRAHKLSNLGGEVGNLILRLPGTSRGP